MRGQKQWLGVQHMCARRVHMSRTGCTARRTNSASSVRHAKLAAAQGSHTPPAHILAGLAHFNVKTETSVATCLALESDRIYAGQERPFRESRYALRLAFRQLLALF